MASGPSSFGERIARLEEQVSHQTEKLQSMQGDIREVRDALREMSGGWKTILAMLAVAGSIGTIVSFVWNRLVSHVN